MEISRYVINSIRDMMYHKRSVSNAELECRYIQPITKSQFIKAITYYRSINPPNTFQEHEETMDIITKTARLRIQGRNTIQKYCSTNLLSENDVVEAVHKVSVQGLTPVFLDYINFKVDIKEEKQIKNIQDILSELPSTPKMFRFKKRISINDVKNGVRYDMTITKSSLSNTHLNFVTSGTVQCPEKYEFEIELTSATDDPHRLIEPMIEAYMMITDTKTVVANKPRLIQNYLSLTGAQAVKPHMVHRKPKKYLVGPKPVSIELKNICNPPILGTPNVVDDYTVVEKTDGERHLLYIDPSGMVYMINNRFDIIYLKTTLSHYKNTILDGEWVSDKSLFALFDAYYINGEDVRKYPLVPNRLKEMKDFHSRSQAAFKQSGIVLHMKDFLHAKKPSDIFSHAKSILEKQQRNEFPYHIDGLIFTPASLPVGGLFKDDKPSGFGTWKSVFKWKPAEENTIDFLVKYERDDKGQPKQIIRRGISYTVCSLYCGYKPSQWEKINIADYLNHGVTQSQVAYMARKFLPPDYVGEDISTYYAPSCFQIEDDSIVEFSYDISKKTWVHLRTRSDKTDLYRKNGITDTANDWGTAINIWRTIQYPVTAKMITGFKEVKQQDVPDENIYYSRNTTRDKFASRPMMDFHNEGIKNMSLIRPEKDRCGRLLDLACGKGGDMNKWFSANIKEVVGFDYVEDNIVNPIDGAYARFQQKFGDDSSKDLNYVFLPMDCSKPLEPSQAYNEGDKHIARLLWSKKPHHEKYAGLMTRSFDVVSCQFAIHYFFENEGVLDTFLKNVDDNLAPGGRFIGTCLDGKKVKKALEKIPKQGSISGKKGERVMWSIKKCYDDSAGIHYGDAIDIYMESIGRIATEYLVDTSVLRQKLESKGYKTVFIKGFDSVYNEVLEQVQDSYKESIGSMTDEEKRYSFMNCMFCFEKTKQSELPSNPAEELEQPMQEPPPPKIKKIAIKKKAPPPPAREPEVPVPPAPQEMPHAPPVPPIKKRITLKKT